MYWLRAREVSQVSGVTASPTVFREDGVTVVRGVAPSENFWDARADVQLLPSGSFVQRCYTVTGASEPIKYTVVDLDLVPDRGTAGSASQIWGVQAGEDRRYGIDFVTDVRIPAGMVNISISGTLGAFRLREGSGAVLCSSGSE